MHQQRRHLLRIPLAAGDLPPLGLDARVGALDQGLGPHQLLQRRIEIGEPVGGLQRRRGFTLHD